MFACCARKGDDVVHEGMIEAHTIDLILEFDHPLARQHRTERMDHLLGGAQLQHATLGLGIGVSQADPHQEPVELVLREQVGALELVRVLGREHHERLLQCVDRAVDGDLGLIHGLQQRRLGPGGRPVDLVGEEDVGEYRTFLQHELTRGAIVDRHPQHICRDHVRRELDAAEGAVDAASDRRREDGLADARHILDQDMPAGEQAADDAIDGDLVAEIDAEDVLAEFVDRAHASPCSPACLVRFGEAGLRAGELL